MKTKILQYLALACLLITVFSSCRKESFGGKENSQAGKTYVWIQEAREYNQFFAPFNNIALVKMFTIRRDPANKADLQKAVTVTLTATPQSVLDTLTDADAGYTSLFGSTIYTDVTSADIASGGQFVGSEGITKTTTGYTVNFAAGEFAKNFYIHVDGSQLDPSAKYVLPLVITNFGGFSGKVGYSSLFSTIGIKNKYDGIYTVKGTTVDITSGKVNNGAVNQYSDFYDYLSSPKAVSDGYVTPNEPMQYELRTSSANTNDSYDNYFYGGYDFTITANGSYSSYGNFSPVFTFDLTTNKVIAVTNHYGQGTNSSQRAAMLDPTGANVYDPGAKTITVKFNMTQPNYSGCSGCSLIAPYIRTTFDYVYTYVAVRN